MPLPFPTTRGLALLATAFADQPYSGSLTGPADESIAGGAGIAPGDAADPFCPGSVLETLEARQLMSVSLDSAGWTVVGPAADSRVVYVSSTGGSDANSGLSPQSPVKSLAKGVSLVRNNSADQLLLKRGDAWRESFGDWKKSGRSEQQPILISAYGGGNRPLIMSGTQNGMNIGSGSARSINHLAIVGVHFWADGRDPSTPGYNRKALSYGINVLSGGSGLLIEDVKVARYMTNVNFYPHFGEMRDVTIRRSAIVDAYDVGNSSLHSQGLFADGVRGLVLEQNVFDHNGWAQNVPGADATIFNHNAYVTGNTSGLVARGNVFAYASSHGLQARSGGVIVGNLFLNNPIGLSFGVVNGSGPQKIGGVSGEVTGNVFVGGRDISGAERGIGLEIANVRAKSGTVVRENIFTNNAGGGLPAISLTYGDGKYEASAARSG